MADQRPPDERPADDVPGPGDIGPSAPEPGIPTTTPGPAPSGTPSSSAGSAPSGVGATPSATVSEPAAAVVTATHTAAAPSPAASGDFAAQIADRVEELVGAVRDRTTRPALIAARSLVFGLMLAVLGIVALVLLLITWNTLLTGLVGKAWIADFITGGILVALGAFLMAKRRPPEIEL